MTDNIQPKISIVVVSLDNPEYFNLLMLGLAQNTKSPFEVLLHVNVPYRVTEWEEVIARWTQYGTLTYVTRSERNLGPFCPANDLFKQAKGEYFVFMDDDMYPAPGWDIAILKKVNPNIKCQYLSPILFQPIDAADTDADKAYNTKSFGKDIESFDPEVFKAQWKDVRNIVEDTQGICGDFFMKASLWYELGGYDPLFYGKGGDLDLKAKVWHLGMVKYGGVFEFYAVADSCLYHFAHIRNNKVGFEPGAPFMDIYVEKWGMTPGEFWQKAVDNGS